MTILSISAMLHHVGGRHDRGGFARTTSTMPQWEEMPHSRCANTSLAKCVELLLASNCVILFACILIALLLGGSVWMSAEEKHCGIRSDDSVRG